MPYSQQSRPYIFSSPLGSDLMLQRFSGREALSELFCFTLELRSERDDIDVVALLRQKATLSLDLDNGGERYWSGEICSFTRSGQSQRFTHYRCELVPPLWFLLHHQDTRHFQQQSVPDIINQVFAEFAFHDYETRLANPHKPLEYSTQFQETSADFLARLMEQDGIHYFFEHEKARSKLILCDNADHYAPLSPSTVRFHYSDVIQEDDCISTLQRRHNLRTGRIVMRDFNFERPHNDLQVSVDTLAHKGDNQPFERFLYATGYDKREDGERLARLMMEAEESRHETLFGESNVRLLTPGYRYSLVDHPVDQMNTDYLITSVEHQGSNNLDGDTPARYSNSFTVIPLKVPFRSPLATQKHRVHGPQTAFVVGPKGEEIHTDAFGRVRVQFHWDRRGHFDERSSCWARVAQAWAGNGWGAFFLPRVGQEVLVSFLEGDPDRPIITGCLFNGVNLPPYALPEHQSRSTLKTLSTPGGGGGNELHFEDRKGEEKIFIHGERDFDVLVKQTIHEQANQRAVKITANHSTSTGADWILETKGKTLITCEDAYHLNARQDIVQASQAKLALLGQAGIEIGSDSTVTIEAKTSISLKVGASFIVLSPAGVDISGPLVRINSGGSPGAVTTIAQAALKQVFPELATIFGQLTQIEGSDRTPDYQSTTAPLTAVERLQQNPGGFVDTRAGRAAANSAQEAQPQANAEQQALSNALRNAARSGHPFVEH
ncbi:type VI secretion system Vgr family protein [Pseudomonas putida]